MQLAQYTQGWDRFSACVSTRTPQPHHHYQQQQQRKSSLYLLSPDYLLDFVWHTAFNCYKIPILRLPKIVQPIEVADLGFENRSSWSQGHISLAVFHLVSYFSGH